MRLMLLNVLILTVVASVRPHAIGYPYRQDLVAYAPSRGEFPVQSSYTQGYIRYLDASGAEHLLPYNYPEPLYGMRRYSYGSEDAPNPHIRTAYQPGHIAPEQPQLPYMPHVPHVPLAPLHPVAPVTPAPPAEPAAQPEQENHFREWCKHRYQALTTEIERLRSKGQEPSADILAQLKPLEEILHAGKQSLLSGETPEQKRTREEHMRIWNEARLKVLELEKEHLKLYAKLDEAHDQQKKEKEQQQHEQKLQQQQAEENLRIYNQNLQYLQQRQEEAERRRHEEQQQPQVAILLKQAPAPVVPTLNPVHSYPKVYQPQYPVHDTPAHLQPLNAEKWKSHGAGLPVLHVVPGVQQPAHQNHAYGYQPDNLNVLRTVPGAPPTQFLQDTAEVVRAREEHLKLVQEAHQGIAKHDQLPSATVYDNTLTLKKVEIPLQHTGVQSSTLESDSHHAHQEARLKEEQRKREEDRLRLHLEEQARQEMESKRLREEQARQEIEAKRLQEEQARQEMEAKRVQEEQARQEMEAKRVQDEKTRQEMEAKRLQEEQARQESESKRQRDELALQEMEMKRKQEEQARQEAETKRVQEEELMKKTELVTEAHAITTDTPLTLQEQYKNNPFLNRLLDESNNKAVTTGIISLVEEKLESKKTEESLPTQDSEMNLKTAPTVLPATTGSDAAALSAVSAMTTQTENKSVTQDALKFGVRIDDSKNTESSGGLSELEKATRNHLRAHEIALEQLRLAKSSKENEKDC